MKNSHPIRNHPWALWVLAISLTLFQQLYADQKKVLYTWPPQPRPQLQASIETFEFDGMTFKQLVLRGHGIEMVMPPLARWQAVGQTSKESIKFKYTGIDTLSLSFSLFGKNTFLPNLSDKTLASYIDGLYAQHQGNIKIINEGNYTPYKSFSIAGSSYKLVEYELKESDTEVLLTREYLLFLNSDLLIIKIEGPPSTVIKVSPLIDASLQQSFLEERQ